MRLLGLILLFMILTMLGCCSGPTEGDNFKSPRDYTWTSDTLQFEEGWQPLMRDIWASSSEDVYITGWSSIPPGSIYHFDGSSWAMVPFHIVQGGDITGSVRPSTVFGFSPDNVWFGGREDYREWGTGIDKDSSVVIHYNGVSWEKVPIHGRHDSAGYAISDIWGSRPDDLWFAGLNGELFHWDGVKIEKDSLPVKMIYTEISAMGTRVSGMPNGDVYLSMENMSGPGRTDQTHFLTNKGNGWLEILPAAWAQWEGLWTSPDETLYTFGGSDGLMGLKNFDGTQWNIIYEAASSVGGSSDNNLIVTRTEGRVIHFNGTDWQLLEAIHHPEIVYKCAWTDGKEAFVVGWIIPWKTVVFHGK